MIRGRSQTKPKLVCLLIGPFSPLSHHFLFKWLSKHDQYCKSLRFYKIYLVCNCVFISLHDSSNLFHRKIFFIEQFFWLLWHLDLCHELGTLLRFLFSHMLLWRANQSKPKECFTCKAAEFTNFKNFIKSFVVRNCMSDKTGNMLIFEDRSVVTSYSCKMLQADYNTRNKLPAL